jgi:hypothetical protein
MAAVASPAAAAVVGVMDIVQSMFMGMAKGAASRQAMAAVAAATIRTWHSLPPTASAEPSASIGDDLFDRDVAARVAAIEKVLRAQLLAGPVSHEDVVLRNVAVHCHCEGKPFGDLSMVEARRYQRGARRLRGPGAPSTMTSTASSSCGGLSGLGDGGGDEVARSLGVSCDTTTCFVDLVVARSEVRLVEVLPIQKNEKQEKAKLPRQGGPDPEGVSEKQIKAKLPRQGGEVGDVEVPGHKQVKVPMIMKQQKFVDAPQVEFVEKIVHEPVQKQIQVPVTKVPVQKKMHVPMIMKQQKCVDVQQCEFVDRVSEEPKHLQVLLEKEEVFQPVAVGIVGKDMTDQIADNFELKGLELSYLLTAGKISVEEYCEALRGSSSSAKVVK